MKSARSFPLLELAVVAACLWLSRDLLNAWQHSPHDRLGWVAMLIWLSPLVVFLARKRELSANAYFLGGAIFLGLAGELTELNFLGHAALAFSLAAWLPFSWRTLVWWLAALSWTPLLGWELASYSSEETLGTRWALSLIGVLCLWPWSNIRKK